MGHIKFSLEKVLWENFMKNTSSSLKNTHPILFPEMRAIACTHTGTHTSKFMCAIYCAREIIVFSCKEKFFIEGFSIEHNQL